MTASKGAAQSRADLVSQSLKRHGLVFIQLGSSFDPLREDLIQGLSAARTSVAARSDWATAANSASTIVVEDLEVCVRAGQNVLGEVREVVFNVLDNGGRVCLISRAPRLAYTSVPGSSVLEDAALVSLPLLSEHELPDEVDARSAGWPLPSASFGNGLTKQVLMDVLSEVGSGLLAALDHALFEVDPKSTDGLQFMGPRELEGLRGAGLIRVDDGSRARLTQSVSSKFLKECLAESVSATIAPSDQLSAVVNGLWRIERTLRLALRAAALAKYGAAWRAGVVGKLGTDVLRRAQLDGTVAAKDIDDVRDPLEWLTLGELLDVVRGEKFDQLGVESAVWRRLQEQLVPIRNRLAHVRMLKADDHEVVRMWSSVIRDRFAAQ